MTRPDLASLPLFLPVEERTPWIALGGAVTGRSVVGDRPAAAEVLRSVSDEPRLVVWFPGRQTTEDREARMRAVRCLDNDGVVFLVWRSGFLQSPAECSALGNLQEGRRLQHRTFVLDAGRLLQKSRFGTRALPRTSKRALLRRTLHRLLPFPRLRYWALPVWHLTVVAPVSGRVPRLWIEEALDRVSRTLEETFTLDDVRWIDRTETGVAIAQVEGRPGRRLALAVAIDDEAQRRLIQHEETLSWLASTDRFPEVLRPALPRLLDRGQLRGRAYLAIPWMGGTPGARHMYVRPRRRKATEAGLRWIFRLHRQSLGPALNPPEVGRWAERVLAEVGTRAGERDRQFEQEMGRYLEEALRRAQLPTVLGHGDYWLGNLVFDPESGEVSGVLDWDQGDDRAPPLEDVLHLIIFQKGLLTPFAPIRKVVGLLTGREARRTRQWIGRYWSEMGLDPAAMGPAVALYWLRFLERRERQFPRTGAWYRAKLEAVKDVLAGRIPDVLDPLGQRIAGKPAGSAR